MSAHDDLSRDARLQAALRHAPDADVRPPDLLRAHILATARQAAARRERAAWWPLRWPAGTWGLGGAGSLAAALLAGTVLWFGREQLPQAPEAQGPRTAADGTIAPVAPVTPSAPAAAPKAAEGAGAGPAAVATEARRTRPAPAAAPAPAPAPETPRAAAAAAAAADAEITPSPPPAPPRRVAEAAAPAALALSQEASTADPSGAGNARGQAKAERSMDAGPGTPSARAPARAFGAPASPVPRWLAERGSGEWRWRDAARPDAAARPLDPAWRDLLAQETKERWQALPGSSTDPADAPATWRRLELLQGERVAGTLVVGGDTVRWCDPGGCATARLTPASVRALLEALER